jgi:SAM-dependent methyltransferase
MQRRDTLLALLAAPWAAPLPAWAQKTADDKPYEPTVGQPGKDVVWVPTPDALVERMLDMTEVTPQDTVVDLGSGDGKIAIAAAKRGARSRGIEYNGDLVKLSRQRAAEQGVKVDFVQGDIFKIDFSRATVVTMYLLPQLNERLRPIIMRMKPGTRVASHQFRMGDWEPDRTDTVEGRSAHLWIVPARVAGRWTVRAQGEPATRLQLTQRFQKIEGRATLEGADAQPLQDGALRGGEVRFALNGAAGDKRQFEGVAAGGRISGTMVLPDGQRKPFTAVRA